MNRIFISAVYAVSFSLTTPGQVEAQDLDKAREALNLIAEFAKSQCDAPPLTGSTTTAELNANGKAEVSKLLKKIAELNIGGDGKYTNSEYIGLLQKDLVTAMQDTRNCKRNVFNDLNDKLIPKLPS